MSSPLLLPLMLAPTATDPDRSFCAVADYYAWCEVYYAESITCLPRDDSLSPGAIDHLWASGAVGVGSALAAILFAVLPLPHPLLLAPTAGILTLVLGTAVALNTDLTGLCGRGPSLETVRLAAWWRGEDPAIAEYCRPVRPYTPLLEPIR